MLISDIKLQVTKVKQIEAVLMGFAPFEGLLRGSDTLIISAEEYKNQMISNYSKQS